VNAANTSRPQIDASLHHAFAAILPVVERHAKVVFRHLKCRSRRDDAVAECVALAWKWFVRLCQRGKDAAAFPTTLACFAARAVRSGRRLCGQERAKDALSPLAQCRHNFVTQAIPEVESGVEGNEVIDALMDNTVTPPCQQAMFRHDFPLWLRRLTRRDRRLAVDLMKGERTLDAASKHRISPARVSQLRRHFCRDWLLFCGGLPVC
jgi:hypothetical protein